MLWVAGQVSCSGHQSLPVLKPADFLAIGLVRKLGPQKAKGLNSLFLSLAFLVAFDLNH